MPWRKDYQIVLSFKIIFFSHNQFHFEIDFGKKIISDRKPSTCPISAFFSPVSIFSCIPWGSVVWSLGQTAKLKAGITYSEVSTNAPFCHAVSDFEVDMQDLEGGHKCDRLPKKWRWVLNVVERCVVSERVKPLLMRDNRAGLAPWKSFRVCRAQEVTHDPAGKVWSFFFSDNLVAGGWKHSIMAPAEMCCQCGGHYQTPLSLCHYILWHCHY